MSARAAHVASLAIVLVGALASPPVLAAQATRADPRADARFPEQDFTTFYRTTTAGSYRAKGFYVKDGPNRFTGTFELAMPGQDYTLFETLVMRRVS